MHLLHRQLAKLRLLIAVALAVVFAGSPLLASASSWRSVQKQAAMACCRTKKQCCCRKAKKAESGVSAALQCDSGCSLPDPGLLPQSALTASIATDSAAPVRLQLETKSESHPIAAGDELIRFQRPPPSQLL